MNAKANPAYHQQSDVTQGVNEIALEEVLADLNVPHAELIKGGPTRPAGGGGGGDIVVWDIVDSHH